MIPAAANYEDNFASALSREIYRRLKKKVVGLVPMSAGNF
jgi:hypothetical protein